LNTGSRTQRAAVRELPVLTVIAGTPEGRILWWRTEVDELNTLFYSGTVWGKP